MDDEIFQDFIVEASEILETLGEELNKLENNPEDEATLNAVFRGFHTVKGGAGFLELHSMVEVCHTAENIFDLLRSKQLTLDSEKMDVILRSLDTVQHMVNTVAGGSELPEADKQLLLDLQNIANQDGNQSAEADMCAQEPAGSDDELSEDEFDAILDSQAATSSSKTEDSSNKSDEISEDEFEQLLDKIATEKETHHKEHVKVGSVEVDNTIDESEFDTLLDELHGEGQGPTQAKTATKTEPSKEAPKTTTPVVTTTQESTVRVDTKRLDHIMNMVGELVLVRNRFSMLASRCKDEDLTKTIANLDMVTADLQTAAMKTRMQPVKKVFGRFPRVVRDLARTLNKQITLEMFGEDTDLDKNLVEALADPLIHMVRNAVDHGIESPEERVEKGKSPVGTITLSAEQSGEHIILSIIDDGAGLDADMLRAKAVEKGVLTKDKVDRLSESECYHLIFAAGFSTKTEVSDISGRGVGMDVVKSKINKLNGNIEIDSTLGFGTTIRIHVPLTLAILPTLMIGIGEQTFALPLASVKEIVQYDLTNLHRVDGQATMTLREKPLPLYHLKNWLTPDNLATLGNSGIVQVIIIGIADKLVGFIVDHLYGQEEVMIKPLGAMLRAIPGIAGATITGDSRISLILDVPKLLETYAQLRL